MGKSEYARHREVSPAMVTHWRKADRIVFTANGMIDVDASDALLAQTMDPARGGRGGKSDRQPLPVATTQRQLEAPEPPRQTPQPDQYTRVRTHREAFAAKTAEAVYRKMIGELVERTEYARGLAQNLGPALQRLDTISARLGSRIAAETDVRKVQDILDDDVVAIRQEIADYAQALIDGVPGTRQ